MGVELGLFQVTLHDAQLRKGLSQDVQTVKAEQGLPALVDVKQPAVRLRSDAYRERTRTKGFGGALLRPAKRLLNPRTICNLVAQILVDGQQDFFGALSIGDVDVDSHHSIRLARSVIQGLSLAEHPTSGFVRPHKTKLDFKG